MLTAATEIEPKNPPYRMKGETETEFLERDPVFMETMRKEKEGTANLKENSVSQLFEWARTDKKVTSKIEKLFTEIERTPYTGTGHPEPLTGDKSGKWSRHITEKDRLVYNIDGETVNIYSCKGHYQGERIISPSQSGIIGARPIF